MQILRFLSPILRQATKEFVPIGHFMPILHAEKIIQRGGAHMPVSFATLQIFDQYLTTYRNRDGSDKSSKRNTRYATHDQTELKDVYNTIQWKNRFAPLYMNDPTPQSIAYAVHLKESAQNLKQTIDSLSGDGTGELFSMKTAYSDNESLASVDYVPEDSKANTPNDFTLEIQNFATPQINTGSFLQSNQPVSLEPGNYSFDLLTNTIHYELQFTVNPNETNSSLQNKLARLINNSDIGVSAKVVKHRKGKKNIKNAQTLSALEITSNAYGKPFQGQRHFTITDENTSYNKGIVKYLGLNRIIKDASNAVYTINGNEQTSYSNVINAYGAFHITLHPENTKKSDSAYNKGNRSAKIGLYPDSESLSYNIETFVDGYNHFLKGVMADISESEGENTAAAADNTVKEAQQNSLDASQQSSLTKLLSKDLTKFLKLHKKSLEGYGISVNDDATLEYEKTAEGTMTDPDALRNFGNHVLRKLNAISLDPMEYVDRRICAYPNPFTNYINPYITSIYTGLLYNVWT